MGTNIFFMSDSTLDGIDEKRLHTTSMSFSESAARMIQTIFYVRLPVGLRTATSDQCGLKINRKSFEKAPRGSEAASSLARDRVHKCGNFQGINLSNGCSPFWHMVCCFLGQA